MIHKNTPLKEVLRLAAPCRCSHCSHGCTYGSGLLVGNDIKNIAAFLRLSEEELKNGFLEEFELFNKKMFRPMLLREGNKPYGKCVFYDKKEGCTINKVKPLECKTSSGCSDYGEELSIWFMLNYVFDKENPESLRQYALYLKSGGRLIPGGALGDLVPDKKKLKKILNYEML